MGASSDPIADCFPRLADTAADTLKQPSASTIATHNPKNDALDSASYLIRVPPGFEDRFEDSVTTGDDAGTTQRRHAMQSEGAAGASVGVLSYEAVAVRIPCEFDQRQRSEFMAPAMQVIPLTVGNFVGDSQLDMHEMVRILRGAADCIGTATDKMVLFLCQIAECYVINSCLIAFNIRSNVRIFDRSVCAAIHLGESGHDRHEYVSRHPFHATATLHASNPVAFEQSIFPFDVIATVAAAAAATIPFTKPAAFKQQTAPTAKTDSLLGIHDNECG